MADAQGVPELARIRASAQLLGRAERRAPADVVRHLLAVQAQDSASVPLALRARSNGLTRADIHAAIDTGELVVSWLNRGTLHLVCSEDYGWLHALTAPTTAAANKRRLAQEGVTNPERGIRLITKALEHGPMPRAAIGERAGVSGPALTHLLLAASLRGLIVRGPIRGREPTFALTRDQVGGLPPVDRETALAELARRYLAGHAPASDADLAYWSGLPLRDARSAMQLARIGAEDRDADRATHAGAAKRAPRGGVSPLQDGDSALPPKLLPPFDPYILGWKDRSFAIPPALTKRVMPGGGMFRAVVLVGGRVTGTWSRSGGRVAIDATGVDGLDAEIADVERFLA